MRPHWRKGIERNLNPSSKLRERKTGYPAGMLGAYPAHHLDHIFTKKSAVEKRSASFFLPNWEGEIIDALFLSSTSAPQKLADLRKAVGWNGMEDLYSNPSLTSFITLRCMSTTLSSVIWTASLSNGVTDAYIQDLMVHLDYQGQGIGTELMNKITAFLKSNIYL